MKTRLITVRRTLSTALLLLATAAGAGCATVDENEDPTIDPDDTTAPLVVDSLPAANQTGVPADEKIVVTFTEPMDPATVEAAYSSTDLPFDQVSFQWNADGTVLEISPDVPLEYAEGTGIDPAAVPARTYALNIGVDAKDLAGNRLEAPLALTFSTRKRLTASFGLALDMTRVTVAISSLGNTEIMVGDNQYGNPYRSYLTFDLATLPAGADIEAARFSGRQLAPEGAPYNLGAVTVGHISYTAIYSGTLNGAVATSLPGMFSQDAVIETKSIDVTSQVADDVTNRVARSNRSQYRLAIDQATNDDPVTDRAIFAKNTFELHTVYVVD